MLDGESYPLQHHIVFYFFTLLPFFMFSTDSMQNLNNFLPYLCLATLLSCFFFFFYHDTMPGNLEKTIYWFVYIIHYYYYYYDSEDVWMPYGSLSSQPGASNVTQAALRLTTL